MSSTMPHAYHTGALRHYPENQCVGPGLVLW
jgi:hypothetical protein